MPFAPMNKAVPLYLEQSRSAIMVVFAVALFGLAVGLMHKGVGIRE